MVADAIAEFRQPVDDTIQEFDSALEEGEQEIVSTIDEGLAHNNEVLEQLGPNLDEAAVRAATEYDRPGWQRFLIALGKAVVFLALAIIGTFVLAALIFVVGLVLVKFGIIAAITFGVALAIAVVLVAIGFVIYELYVRVQAYMAEHGPVDSFWEALGISAALVGISIASLTGIPQIIEGLVGRRAFSERQLSPQARYDLVVGGALQLILLVGGRFVARQGRSGGGGRGRGIFERLNRTIERTIERWFFGEEGQPARREGRLPPLEQPGGRQTERVEGLYESIDPANPPEGYTFVDRVEVSSGGEIRVDTTVTAPDGTTGIMARILDPTTGRFTFHDVALNDIPRPLRMVATQPEMVLGRGTPLEAYMTMRQIKLIQEQTGRGGLFFSARRIVHLSEITNVKTKEWSITQFSSRK